MDDTLADVRPLVLPRSLAVVGASPRLARLIEGIVGSGLPAWGVNPNREDVLGLRCYPSIAELPARPELALLLVGHGRVEQAFEEAAQAGVRAFVLPGLGNEAGAEGPPIARRIAARAAELGAVVLGPNCMGVALSEGASLWIGTVPKTFLPGHVSVVTQSGSIGEALVSLGPRIGFRSVVSSGGEAVCDAADFLAFFAEDEATRAVGLFLETVRRPAAFAAALAACAAAEKPVACLKVGRSQAAARAALAHTGALVGSDRAFSALLRRYGAIETQDFPELVETLELLGRRRRPRGLRVGAISESGGEGALLADHAEDAGMPFEPLPAELVAELRAEFPNYVSPGNPLDAWAIDEPGRVFPRSLDLMARSGAFDILIAQVDHSQFRGEQEHEWCALILRALADAVEGTAVFPAGTTVHTVDPWPDVAALARERDVPLLRGPRTAIRALAAVARWRPSRPPSPDGRAPVDLSDLLGAEGPLPEYESSLVLERYGVPLAPRRRAHSPEDAARAAAELGPPVVVKLDGPAHKNREGGVVLGLARAEEAASAAERFGGRVLVAKQVEAGPEIFCGFTRDPDFGAVLAVGAGGTAVEAIGRPIVALAPLDRDSALELVSEARLPGADEVARTLVALSRLALEHEEIAEADVNPLIVRPDGAVAVDALVVIKRGESR